MPTPPAFEALLRSPTNYSNTDRGFFKNLLGRFRSATEQEFVGDLYAPGELEHAFAIGQFPETDAFRLECAKWHVSTAEDFLRWQQLPAGSRSRARKLSAAGRDLEIALADVELAERPAKGDAICLPMLLTIEEDGVKKGVIRRFRVELVPGGTGEIYAALSVAFMPCDEAWVEAERNAHHALRHLKWWPARSTFDLRWSFAGDTPLPAGLTGGSAGALLAFAAANLLASQNLQPPGAADLCVDPVFLNEVTITAQIDRRGNLRPASAEPVKIKKVIENAGASTKIEVISTIVVAENALGRILGDTLAEWKGTRNGHRITYEKIPWTVIGVRNLEEAAAYLREEQTLSWVRKLTWPLPMVDNLFDLYKRYLGSETATRQRQSASFPSWIRPPDFGESFLEVCFGTADDETKGFVRLFPLLSRHVVEHGLSLSDEKTLEAISTSVSPVLAAHIIGQLQDDSGIRSRLVRREEDVFTIPQTNTKIRLEVERHLLSPHAKEKRSVIIPSHAAGQLKKDETFSGLFRKLEEKLGNGAYYVWTIRVIGGSGQPKLWNPLNKEISEKLVALIEEAGRPRRRILDLARTERFVSKLQSHYPRFRWHVPPPVGTYQTRDEDFTKLEVALRNPQSIHVGIHAGVRGTGGLGKTQLTRAFLHHQLKKWDASPDECAFPDGVIEINLRAHNFGIASDRSSQLPPLAPDAVAEAILTLLGVDENTLGRHRRAGTLFEHYQEVLKRKSVLLVLDNAADWAQVKPLLPAPRPKEDFDAPGFRPSRAIVTSRGPLTTEGQSGIKEIKLDAWDEEKTGFYLDSRGAFGGKLPSGGYDFERPRPLDSEQMEAAKKVCVLTGGLPLAIQIVASMAVSSETHGETSVLERIVEYFNKRRANAAQGGDGGEEKEAKSESIESPMDDLLDLCLSGLQSTTRELHESLIVFPVQFDAAAAASVWQTQSVHDASEQLDFFVDRGLLMREWNVHLQIGSRTCALPSYRMHDLIREHATKRFRARRDCAEREARDLFHFVAHYAGRQAFENDLLRHAVPGLRALTGRQNVELAALLFDNDQFNFELAAERHRKLINAFHPDRMSSLLAGAGTRLSDLLLSASKRVGRTRNGLLAALTSLRRGEVAVNSWRMADIRRERAMHFNSLGLAYRHQGERNKARKYFRRAILAAQGLRWDQGLACAWGNSGNIQQELAGEARDDLKKRERHLRWALRFHLRAERFSRACGDELMQAIDWGNQAIVWMDLWTNKLRTDTAYYRALELYVRRIKTALRKEFNDRRGAANGYGNMASALLAWACRKHGLKPVAEDQIPPEQRRAADQVVRYYKRAIRHHRAGCNPRGVAANEGNLARAYRLLAPIYPSRGSQYLGDALELTERSLATFREVGDMLGERVALANLLAFQLMEQSAASVDDADKTRALLRAVEVRLVAIKAVKEDELVHTAAAGPKLDDMRQLSDKYGKLVSLNLEILAAGGDRLAKEVFKAYGLSEILIREILQPPPRDGAAS